MIGMDTFTKRKNWVRICYLLYLYYSPVLKEWAMEFDEAVFDAFEAEIGAFYILEIEEARYCLYGTR